MKVAVKYFYKEIDYVTTTIWRLGLVNNLIEAAKQQNYKKLQIVVDEFKMHQSDFWKRMCELYEDYENEDWPTIFTGEENKEYYKYNSLKINPVHLICCCALSDTVMNPYTLFYDSDTLEKSLRTYGYNEIADYFNEKTISTLDDLMRAFKK